MGTCDIWNVEINILVYESEMFSLPAEFHFNDLATYIYLSIWLVGAYTPPSINFESRQKDASFTQKYLWQYNNSNQKSLSSRHDYNKF